MHTEKTCRVCLSESDELTPLWVKLPGENKSLEETINFVVNINIKLEDGVPDKICKTCESVLDLADIFKQRCLESESILEQQAQEKQNGETLPKCKRTHQENIEINSEDTSCLPTSISQTSLTDAISEITKSAENIYDLPENKIKMEIVEHHVDAGVTISEQENFGTRVDEISKEQCVIKEEFYAGTKKYSDNKDLFPCQNCNLTFKTKMSYKVHVFFTHSTFIHTKDAPSLKKPKSDDMQPTTAEVRSATEDPAVADTSTATVIGTERDYEKAKNAKITRGNKKRNNKKKLKFKQNKVKKTSKDKTKKESTKDTAAVLKRSGTNTDDKVTCATEKQSECFNNTVIGTTGDIHTCDICGYTAATVKSLNSHLKAHAATKRYSCDSCLYLTKNLNNFNRHATTHIEDKPYSCDMCEKMFRNKYYLITHLRIHAGEMSYSCDVCEKQFVLKSNLNKHMKTHTGERPYSCDVCGRTFSHRFSLVPHARTHTSEKPYSCNVCNKKFKQSHSLVRHCRTHR